MDTTTAAKLLNHRIIGSRYFFPRPTSPAAPFIVDVPGARLACARYDGGHQKTLLHFHGNGEVVADWQGEYPNQVDAAGFNLVLAEYRGYGGSTGVPELATALDDALAVADSLGSTAEIVVYGRSVGSLFALHVASSRDVAALVIESGIADVHERVRLRVDPIELGASEDELLHAVRLLFDHEAKTTQHNGPMLVVHTQHDGIVDTSHARRLAQWAGDRAELVIYPAGNHNNIHYYNGDDILARVSRFAK